MVNVKIFMKDVNQLPIRQNIGDAGYDVCSNEVVVLDPGEVKLIKTGVYMEIPDGYECQIRPRSGLALKYGITVLNNPGTVDSTYRGEVGVILMNCSNKPFNISKGDRIAQMVFNKYENVSFNVVRSQGDLEKSNRGKGGLGSTGT